VNTLAPETSDSANAIASRPDAWTKVTVVLRDRQIVYLDRLSADIRSASGAILKRAEIIRTLVDLLEETGVPPGKIRSAADLKNGLRRGAPASGSETP
jgi:hypothetical protein